MELPSSGRSQYLGLHRIIGLALMQMGVATPYCWGQKKCPSDGGRHDPPSPKAVYRPEPTTDVSRTKHLAQFEPAPDAEFAVSFRLPGIVHALHTTCRPQSAGNQARKDLVGGRSQPGRSRRPYRRTPMKLSTVTTLFRYRAGKNKSSRGWRSDQMSGRRETFGSGWRS